MITVNLRGDMSVAIKAVGQLSEATQSKAVARALNRAATTVRRDAAKLIGGRYNLDKTRINSVLKIRQANAGTGQLSAVVYAKDKRMALSAFGRASLERKFKRAQAGKAARRLTVKVLRGGSAKAVTGKPEYEGTPFLQVVGNGHLGIFQRVGSARRPFRELMSVSVPGGLATRAIREALVKVAQERFNKELVANLKYYGSRG